MFPKWIPTGVRYVVEKLKEAGFHAYIVGGAVRDLLLDATPKDWDVATNARPEQVMEVFPRAVPVGLKFGTVAVLTPDVGSVEITTFRRDGRYVDGRRPEEVYYTDNLLEDLSRRDLTINAMAMTETGDFLDPFSGAKDLEAGIIRTVGNPVERFKEDALRMMRIYRFAARYGFTVDKQTFDATMEMAEDIRRVSMERIWSELIGTLVAPDARKGLEGLMESGLLRVIIPEIAPLVGFDQRSKYHMFDLWEHTLQVVQNTPAHAVLRTVALLHDIAKPVTQTIAEDGVAHYIGHDRKGAEMSDAILRRLKVSNDFRKEVVDLIRLHMFPEEAGVKAVRRLLRDHGEEFVRELLTFRDADMKATGRYPNGFRSRLWDVVVEIKEQGGAPKLAINGHDIMAILGVTGPEVGKWKRHLEELILEDPSKNDPRYLTRYLLELQDHLTYGER